MELNVLSATRFEILLLTKAQGLFSFFKSMEWNRPRQLVNIGNKL
jgi:hypothetical protein